MNIFAQVPGSKSLDMFNQESQYMAPGLQSIALFSEIVVKKAKGVYVTDLDGNSFIDINAGVAVGSIGHCHPHFVNVMTRQLKDAVFGSFCTENRVEFLKTLSSITPEGIDSFQMFSGGAEAVEAALRLAKSVTKKYEFAGFWGGFHGKTGGVLPLLGDKSFKKDLGPLMPGLYLAGPFAYCYRCFFKMTWPDCGFACVDFFRESLKRQTSHNIAAILIEPIQGTAGNVVPPKGYMQAIQEVAREFDALIIADEMITGFGRTGLMWGVDHDSVIPDIMTLGKGIGGGFPMSVIASTHEFTQALPFSNPSGSSSSYGGNPLASAAGRASLEIIIKENLVENSRTVGAFMKQKLREFMELCPIIGDVRGQGLMIGLELVKNCRTKEPLDSTLTRRLYHECLNRGLICMCYNPVIRINPPLIITKDEAEQALNILFESLMVIAQAKGHKNNAS